MNASSLFTISIDRGGVKRATNRLTENKENNHQLERIITNNNIDQLFRELRLDKAGPNPIEILKATNYGMIIKDFGQILDECPITHEAYGKLSKFKDKIQKVEENLTAKVYPAAYKLANCLIKRNENILQHIVELIGQLSDLLTQLEYEFDQPYFYMKQIIEGFKLHVCYLWHMFIDPILNNEGKGQDIHTAKCLNRLQNIKVLKKDRHNNIKFPVLYDNILWEMFEYVETSARLAKPETYILSHNDIDSTSRIQCETVYFELQELKRIRLPVPLSQAVKRKLDLTATGLSSGSIGSKKQLLMQGGLSDVDNDNETTEYSDDTIIMQKMSNKRGRPVGDRPCKIESIKKIIKLEYLPPSTPIAVNKGEIKPLEDNKDGRENTQGQLPTDKKPPEEEVQLPEQEPSQPVLSTETTSKREHAVDTVIGKIEDEEEEDREEEEDEEPAEDKETILKPKPRPDATVITVESKKNVLAGDVIDQQVDYLYTSLNNILVQMFDIERSLPTWYIEIKRQSTMHAQPGDIADSEHIYKQKQSLNESIIGFIVSDEVIRMDLYTALRIFLGHNFSNADKLKRLYKLAMTYSSAKGSKLLPTGDKYMGKYITYRTVSDLMLKYVKHTTRIQEIISDLKEIERRCKFEILTLRTEPFDEDLNSLIAQHSKLVKEYSGLANEVAKIKTSRHDYVKVNTEAVLPQLPDMKQSFDRAKDTLHKLKKRLEVDRQKEIVNEARKKLAMLTYDDVKQLVKSVDPLSEMNQANVYDNDGIKLDLASFCAQYLKQKVNSLAQMMTTTETNQNNLKFDPVVPGRLALMDALFYHTPDKYSLGPYTRYNDIISKIMKTFHENDGRAIENLGYLLGQNNNILLCKMPEEELVRVWETVYNDAEVLLSKRKVADRERVCDKYEAQIHKDKSIRLKGIMQKWTDIFANNSTNPFEYNSNVCDTLLEELDKLKNKNQDRINEIKSLNGLESKDLLRTCKYFSLNINQEESRVQREAITLAKGKDCIVKQRKEDGEVVLKALKNGACSENNELWDHEANRRIAMKCILQTEKDVNAAVIGARCNILRSINDVLQSFTRIECMQNIAYVTIKIDPKNVTFLNAIQAQVTWLKYLNSDLNLRVEIPEDVIATLNVLMSKSQVYKDNLVNFKYKVVSWAEQGGISVDNIKHTINGILSSLEASLAEYHKEQLDIAANEKVQQIKRDLNDYIKKDILSPGIYAIKMQAAKFQLTKIAQLVAQLTKEYPNQRGEMFVKLKQTLTKDLTEAISKVKTFMKEEDSLKLERIASELGTAMALQRAPDQASFLEKINQLKHLVINRGLSDLYIKKLGPVMKEGAMNWLDINIQDGYTLLNNINDAVSSLVDDFKNRSDWQNVLSGVVSEINAYNNCARESMAGYKNITLSAYNAFNEIGRGQIVGHFKNVVDKNVNHLEDLVYILDHLTICIQTVVTVGEEYGKRAKVVQHVTKVATDVAGLIHDALKMIVNKLVDIKAESDETTWLSENVTHSTQNVSLLIEQMNQGRRNMTTDNTMDTGEDDDELHDIDTYFDKLQTISEIIYRVKQKQEPEQINLNNFITKADSDFQRNVKNEFLGKAFQTEMPGKWRHHLQLIKAEVDGALKEDMTSRLTYLYREEDILQEGIRTKIKRHKDSIQLGLINNILKCKDIGYELLKDIFNIENNVEMASFLDTPINLYINHIKASIAHLSTQQNATRFNKIGDYNQMQQDVFEVCKKTTNSAIKDEFDWSGKKTVTTYIIGEICKWIAEESLAKTIKFFLPNSQLQLVAFPVVTTWKMFVRNVRALCSLYNKWLSIDVSGEIQDVFLYDEMLQQLNRIMTDISDQVPCFKSTPPVEVYHKLKDALTKSIQRARELTSTYIDIMEHYKDLTMTSEHKISSLMILEPNVFVSCSPNFAKLEQHIATIDTKLNALNQRVNSVANVKDTYHINSVYRTLDLKGTNVSKKWEIKTALHLPYQFDNIPNLKPYMISVAKNNNLRSQIAVAKTSGRLAGFDKWKDIWQLLPSELDEHTLLDTLLQRVCNILSGPLPENEQNSVAVRNRIIDTIVHASFSLQNVNEKPPHIVYMQDPYLSYLKIASNTLVLVNEHTMEIIQKPVPNSIHSIFELIIPSIYNSINYETQVTSSIPSHQQIPYTDSFRRLDKSAMIATTVKMGDIWPIIKTIVKLIADNDLQTLTQFIGSRNTWIDELKLITTDYDNEETVVILGEKAQKISFKIKDFYAMCMLIAEIYFAIRGMQGKQSQHFSNNLQSFVVGAAINKDRLKQLDLTDPILGGSDCTTQLINLAILAERVQPGLASYVKDAILAGQKSPEERSRDAYSRLLGIFKVYINFTTISNPKSHDGNYSAWATGSKGDEFKDLEPLYNLDNASLFHSIRWDNNNAIGEIPDEYRFHACLISALLSFTKKTETVIKSIFGIMGVYGVYFSSHDIKPGIPPSNQFCIEAAKILRAWLAYRLVKNDSKELASAWERWGIRNKTLTQHLTDFYINDMIFLTTQTNEDECLVNETSSKKVEMAILQQIYGIQTIAAGEGMGPRFATSRRYKLRPTAAEEGTRIIPCLFDVFVFCSMTGIPLSVMDRDHIEGAAFNGWRERMNTTYNPCLDFNQKSTNLLTLTQINRQLMGSILSHDKSYARLLLTVPIDDDTCCVAEGLKENFKYSQAIRQYKTIPILMVSLKDGNEIHGLHGISYSKLHHDANTPINGVDPIGYEEPTILYDLSVKANFTQALDIDAKHKLPIETSTVDHLVGLSTLAQASTELYCRRSSVTEVIRPETGFHILNEDEKEEVGVETSSAASFDDEDDEFSLQNTNAEDSISFSPGEPPSAAACSSSSPEEPPDLPVVHSSSDNESHEASRREMEMAAAHEVSTTESIMIPEAAAAGEIDDQIAYSQPISTGAASSPALVTQSRTRMRQPRFNVKIGRPLSRKNRIIKASQYVSRSKCESFATTSSAAAAAAAATITSTTTVTPPTLPSQLSNRGELIEICSPSPGIQTFCRSSKITQTPSNILNDIAVIVPTDEDWPILERALSPVIKRRLTLSDTYNYVSGNNQRKLNKMFVDRSFTISKDISDIMNVL